MSSGTGTAAGYTLHEFTSTGSSALDFSSLLNLDTRLGATLTNGITGTGNLTYSGPGTLTLNAANTYSGATAITGGTLAFGSSGSIPNSSGVSISSGATFDVSTATSPTIGAAQTLSGTGTVNGAITIDGTHSPGNSPGLQTFSSNLTYSTGASVTWELISNTEAAGDAGTQYDQIAVGGNLDYSGAAALDLAFNISGSSVDWTAAFWDNDRAWTLWDLSTGTTSNLSNLAITSANWLDSNSATFSSARPNASFSLGKVGEDVNLFYTAVPEPSSLLLVAAGAGIAWVARNRRRWCP